MQYLWRCPGHGLQGAWDCRGASGGRDPPMRRMPRYSHDHLRRKACSSLELLSGHATQQEGKPVGRINGARRLSLTFGVYAPHAFIVRAFSMARMPPARAVSGFLALVVVVKTAR